MKANIKRLNELIYENYNDDESSEVIINSNLVPVGWVEITTPHRRQDLQFAINQLEKRNKPYIIKRHRGKDISIYVKKR